MVERKGKIDNEFHLRKNKTKPKDLKPPQSDGKLGYLYGAGDATPETAQERMLRMLAAQHPESASQIPHADVSQNQLHQVLNARKKPKNNT